MFRDKLNEYLLHSTYYFVMVILLDLILYYRISLFLYLHFVYMIYARKSYILYISHVFILIYNLNLLLRILHDVIQKHKRKYFYKINT